MSHHDKVSFTDADNGKFFLLNSTDASGCSTRFKELVSTSGHFTEMEQRQPLNGDFYRRIEQYHEYSGCGTRALGFFYTRGDDVREYMKPKTKAVFNRNRIYKMYRGGVDSATFIVPKKDKLLTLHDGQEVRAHMPLWCIRPHEIINPEAMLATGFIRSTMMSGATDPTAPWRSECDYLDYEREYGENARYICRDPQQETISGSCTTGGYWGTGHRMSRMQFNTSHPHVDNIGYTETHKSREVCEVLDHMPWWVRLYIGGINMASSTDVMRAAADGAFEDLIANEERDLVAVGGNWNCTSSADAIRIVCAFAEEVCYKGGAMMGEEHYTYTSVGERIYYAILPYIYESPQHSSHPCCCMFFSLSPITIKEVTHDTV